MSIEELVRGPKRGVGPTGPWTIVGGKSEGLTPGFGVVDGDGERYVLKLDPVGVPELSSAAEVIATKLFYALGYNVPENYIVRFEPNALRIQPDAHVEERFRKSTQLTETRVRRMLARIPRLDDGRIRASQFVDGRPLGPFRYSGTRSDDPNDVVVHEDRRELRCLRLFAAWLNHDDARAHNTLDAWTPAADSDTHYVQHYLIDFGSTFGSGTIDLQLPNLSFHYWLDFDLIKKNALGLGFHVPEYRKVKWSNYPELQSIGRWVATYFDPASGRPIAPTLRSCA